METAAMAAPGPASRTARREEPSVSLESVTAKASVHNASPGHLCAPVPPGQSAEPPGKSLWEQICEEFEAELPPFPEGYNVKQEGVIAMSTSQASSELKDSQMAAALMAGECQVSPFEELVFHGFNAEHLYPAPPLATDSHPEPCPSVSSKEIHPQTCSPKDYLETFIFPVLLPGMANLLHQAKKEKCFERKRTKFIACDFLTEWLYNPRPPIPLSLLLTEVEAVIIIQSFWRAYLVRCDPEIQELRQWQKKLREDKHIRQRVEFFWTKQELKVKCKMEDDEEPSVAIPQP